jgi:uncharacterized protein (TIGR02996 family)
MISPDTLLAAIIADPANDDLRLVFADLLDDRGEGERAEFIRLQIKLVDHPKHHTADSGCRFRGRERELLRNHSLKWLQGIPFQCIEFKDEGPIPSVACGLASRQSLDSEFYFERGFVYKVRLSCADWVQRGPALVRRHPIERCVIIGREPIQLQSDIGTGWNWMMGNPEPESPWFVPLELFTLIDLPFAIIDGQEMPGKVSPTEAAAIDALSKAALLYARQTEPATVHM